MTVQSTAPTLEEIDLSLEDFTQGFPHELFTVLREQAPVWLHPETPGVRELGGPFWVVSTLEEIKTVSADHTTYRCFEGPKIPDWDHNARGMMLITMDPPDHTRLRKLVNKGFTLRMTAKLEDQARAWAARIVDEALEAGEGNFVEQVAAKLPAHMIADIVGIPEEDRAPLFKIVKLAIEAQSNQLPIEEQQARMAEMFGYAHELADRKRQSPADDVWTKLTTAEVEQPDGTSTRLSEFELDLFFMVLTIAGSETTRDTITGGLLALIQNPDQMQLLRSDLSLMSTAADEMVRWASPVAVFRRTATRDAVLRGEQIKAGDKVSLWYPSANRDATVFTDPFRFDVTRDPNPHVGFGGHGVHYCLGANLARREIRVMFEELLSRTRDIELIGEPAYRLGHIDIMTPCGIKDLPVRLTAR